MHDTLQRRQPSRAGSSCARSAPAPVVQAVRILILADGSAGPCRYALRPDVTLAPPQRVTRVGDTFITHHDVRTRSLPKSDRTTVSMIPATPAETTGEIILSWGPDGPVVTAPDRAAAPALELFGMRRVPGEPRAVEFPGSIAAEAAQPR
jgi:hypothetical protein